MALRRQVTLSEEIVKEIQNHLGGRQRVGYWVETVVARELERLKIAEGRAEPGPKPKPKPKPRQPFDGSPHTIIKQPRTYSHLNGDCWTFGTGVWEGWVRTAKANGRPNLIVFTEYDGAGVYDLWLDGKERSILLETLHEDDGTPYYLINCASLVVGRNPYVRRHVDDNRQGP